MSETQEILTEAQNALDKALSPGGTTTDIVNVPMTKEQIAVLLALISESDLLE